jgi:Na+:H+ antiporter, NhaA family
VRHRLAAGRCVSEVALTAPADSPSTSEQTRLEKKFERALTPFQEFVGDQTTSSMLLIACTATALIIANSPFSGEYEKLIETPLGLVFGEHALQMELRHWINDGLMTLFFFLIGLEIKRELLVGELKDLQRSLPVICAALGGMLTPALIFSTLNASGEYAHGWGIPMATDTAFVVGIMALLGGRIPPAAVTFLTALAIIDDLGAILVIAAFYSDTISVPHLAAAAVVLALLIQLNRLGVRTPGLYLLGGILVWGAMLGSGVHPTVAGILVAATVPARSKRQPGWFVRRTQRLVDRFREIEERKETSQPMLGESEQHAVVAGVQDAAEKATTPLRRWEHALDRPVSLLVMPLFALANAGIPLNYHILETLWTSSLSLGVILGLVLGKGTGIPLFTWLAIRLKLGRLPQGVAMRHIVGLGILAGTGFTMSIFISRLGFAGMPEAMVAAKGGILLASLIAGCAGYLWMRLRG